MRMFGATAGMVLVLVSLLGCEPGGPGRGDGLPSTSEATLYDSAGVLISVTGGASARSPLGWDVDPFPDLVIGAGDSPSEYLYRVQGVRGLPGGGVLVVDGGSRELRFFDSQGTLVRRAGGEGEGPGEFRDPVLVPWLGIDSLLLFDKRLPRFQILAMDGDYLRAFRHVKGWPAGRTAPLGAGVHKMLFRLLRPIGAGVAAKGEGLVQNRFIYFWYDAAVGDTAVLDSFIWESFTTSSATHSIPFRALPAAAVRQDTAVITSGRAPEIREYDSDGRLRRILRVDEARRPVTPALIEAKAEIEASLYSGSFSTSAFWAAEFAQMPIPDSLPVFKSLLIDETGWLWAEVYEFDPSLPKEWMVFDPEGRARGTLKTPHGLQVEWIGEDAILGVWQDEMNVEQVRRHRLRRGGPSRGVPEPPLSDIQGGER